MNNYPRKRPSETSREVAELRERSKGWPAECAIPLAGALNDLATEYWAIGNLDAARRHMNASIRAGRVALASPEIDDGRKRLMVEFLWDSARLHHRQEHVERALRDIDEAIALDCATWDAHHYCLGPREYRHANMLQFRATCLEDLGRVAEADESRTEAILMAMSDPDYEEYQADEVLVRIANDLVQPGA